MANKQQSIEAVVARLPTVDSNSDDGWVDMEYDTRIEAIIARGFVLQYARSKNSIGQAVIVDLPGQASTILKIRKVKRDAI